jgi:hypothetical protein
MPAVRAGDVAVVNLPCARSPSLPLLNCSRKKVDEFCGRSQIFHANVAELLGITEAGVADESALQAQAEFWILRQVEILLDVAVDGDERVVAIEEKVDRVPLLEVFGQGVLGRPQAGDGSGDVVIDNVVEVVCQFDGDAGLRGTPVTRSADDDMGFAGFFMTDLTAF